MLQRHASPEPHPEDPDRSPVPQQPPAGDVSALKAPVQLDPEKMRPRAVLYVRISEEALRTRRGVAYAEGVGPITAKQVGEFLGHHHVTVRPILDLRGQVPVDAYEVPADLREAMRLARPSSVFPWSRTGTTTVDFDHTQPYLSVEHGGPAGQTRTSNLGPMVRFGHRVKTHGRGWKHRQPQAGVYLWRTPHGYWFRVDNDGTHALGRDPDLSVHDPPPTQTPLEFAFVDLINNS